MNKSETAELKSLFIDLNDRNADNVISHSITELKKLGYKSVEIEAKILTELDAVKLQVDINLFTRIKQVQELPDSVIIKLFLADRKLKSSNFKERLLNA